MTVPKLPVTVTAVTPVAGGLYDVAVAYADLTIAHYLIPVTLATIEAVTYSALAMAMLSDPDVARRNSHHSKHARYSPRT